MCFCMWCRRAHIHMCGSWKTAVCSQFSPSTIMWVPEIDSRSLGLQSEALLPARPSCWASAFIFGIKFLSLNLELSNSARSTNPRNLVSAFPHARTAEAYCHTWLFTWVSGTWTQVTMFMEQPLGSTGPPHSPYFSFSPNTIQPHST